ncbi:MAG: F0F1 ATP synthase subunit alpha, partial [Lachnospiraceae bacterium]|nr:F0F1 ATP synthase subunit alpha [Lachnospiraceae bacterium]
PVDRIGEFENSFFEYIKTSYPEIPDSIRTTKELSEEMEDKLKKAIEDFKADFLK